MRWSLRCGRAVCTAWCSRPYSAAIRAKPSTFYEVVERIAAVDGSTGWCAAIGAGTNIFAGYMTEAGARAVFADPDAGSASIFAPTGMAVHDGGQWRLSGRWAFSSNCLHSAWIAVGAFVDGHRRRGRAGAAERWSSCP